MSNELVHLLRDSCVETVVGQFRKIITVSGTDKVGTALRKLEEHSLFAAPVVDLNGKPFGMLELEDLISFAISVRSFNQRDVILQNLDDLLVEGNLFFEEKVATLMERKSKILYSVDNKTPLISIVEELSSATYRNALVTNNEGDLLNIISQSDVTNFLIKNSHRLKGELTISVDSLCQQHKIGLKEVISVTPLTSVMDALQLLHFNNISAVAVLDQSKKIVGNFSTSDIRSLSEPWNYRLLGQHVKNFLEFTSKRNTKPVICSLSDTLESVLQKMATEHIHRLYIIDQAENLAGIISFTDVMQYVIKQAMKFMKEPSIKNKI